MEGNNNLAVLSNNEIEFVEIIILLDDYQNQEKKYKVTIVKGITIIDLKQLLIDNNQKEFEKISKNIHDKINIFLKKEDTPLDITINIYRNDQLLEDFNQMCNELGFNYLEKKTLKKSIERIHIERVGFPSALSVRIKKVITEKLKTIMSSESDLKKIIEEVESNLSKSIKDTIGANLEVKASIIYEIFVSDI